MPSTEEITAIEGIVFVDNQPPGGLGGTASGIACIVGEFADMSQAVSVDSTGKVTFLARPLYVENAADFEVKYGSFDSTLGRFGSAMGNGYTAATGKTYGRARLLCQPVNLCSEYAGRMWRVLPTCSSSTDPSPVVPVVPGFVAAATEFRTGVQRVRTGVRATFTGDAYFSSAVDGSVTAAGAPAATQTFTSATGDFTGAAISSRKVYKGDVLVLGVIGALGGLGANADTYRVVSVTNATTLVVEKMDGSNFNWTTSASLPWRIHPGATADTSGRASGGQTDAYPLSDVRGYRIAARPLDVTIPAASTISPTSPAITPTATLWEALSGLKFRTHPTQPLTFTANVQTPNSTTTAEIEALYRQALNGLLGDDYPKSDIEAVVCARKSANIASYTLQHCQSSFSGGNPRVCFISPPVNTLLSDDVLGTSYPGVEQLRSRFVEYHWPAVQVQPISTLIGLAISTSDGQTTTNGDIDQPADEFRLAQFTMLAPERSPAQASEPTPTAFATITGYARGVTAPNLSTFMLLKARGICAMKIDKAPVQIQSAKNTLSPRFAADPATPANRQIFANFLMRSLRVIASPKKSELATQVEVDGLFTDVTSFLDSLGPQGSAITPQRIKAYRVTRISTTAEEDAGIFKFKVDVKMLSTMDFLVFSVTAGTTVDVTQEV